MHITYISTLSEQRALYEKPRDMESFCWYLEQMLAGTDDVHLPITSVNPMGHAHFLHAVQALLAIDAEDVAERAAHAAAEELPDIGGPVKVFINLLDDRTSGWTNRTYTEFINHYGEAARTRKNQRRRFAGVWFWTSETCTVEKIHGATRDSLFRIAHQFTHGVPRTLREMLELDRAAFEFSGMRVAALDVKELEYTRALIEPYLDAVDQPTCIAILFGDDAARACGYPPLGVSMRTGQRLR
ncbi:MAG: hypothetical protein NTZ50_07120 [Chloroflexi bacterium]|nr:hypothetical protein [Chloroflexota bacterium]